MPEQFLNFTQIGTHIEQMGCVAVPKPMGVNMLIQICAHRSLSQDPTRLTSRKATKTSFTPRPKRNKERFAHHARMSPNLEPFAERAARLFRNRDYTFFAALPHHANLARSQLEIANIQGNQLTDANPGSIEQLDERPIAQRHPLGTSLSIATFRRGLA
jgi:hypothetical protein